MQRVPKRAHRAIPHGWGDRSLSHLRPHSHISAGSSRSLPFFSPGGQSSANPAATSACNASLRARDADAAFHLAASRSSRPCGPTSTGGWFFRRTGPRPAVHVNGPLAAARFGADAAWWGSPSACGLSSGSAKQSGPRSAPAQSGRPSAVDRCTPAAGLPLGQSTSPPGSSSGAARSSSRITAVSATPRSRQGRSLA